MYTVDDLKGMFSLSRRQVYTRLDALEHLDDVDFTSGSNGKKLLSEKNFKLFERLQALMNEGISSKFAVDIIRKERRNNDSNSEVGDVNLAKSDVELAKIQEQRIQQLRERITELNQDKAFLQDQVKELQGKLLPGRVNNKGIIRRIWARIW